MDCKGNCGSCGNCSSCGGCAQELVLTPEELEMLLALGQFSFLPVARSLQEDTPIYLEDNRHTQEEYSLILQMLEKKGLITLDYDKPLLGTDMSGYKKYPLQGSMALTARGQRVLELIELQGIGE